MRCSNCNVDLGESYETCPLCGAPAADVPPVLTAITEAPYPEGPKKAPKEKERVCPNKYVLRVIGVLCLLFCFSGNRLLSNLLAPLLLVGASIYLFICGLKEKGELLHSAVALLAAFGIEFALTVLHLLLRHSVNTTLFAAIVTLALTVILYALRTDRFTTQMQALFRR